MIAIPKSVVIAGKCVMLAGGVVASLTTGGNPLVISVLRVLEQGYNIRFKRIYGFVNISNKA